MKRLIKVLLAAVVLLIIGGVVLVMSLDSIAAETIRRGGTYALGVETTVDEVDIGLGSELEASMTGLSIANPTGYSAERFFGLGQGSLRFPTSGLMASVVTVPELKLDGIEINLERRGGKNNYDVILEHLASHGGGDDGSGGSEPGKQDEDDDAPGGKRFAIERIVMTQISATVDLVPLAGDKSRVGVTIPQIVIENLSSDMSTAEIFEVVIQTLLAAVLENGAGLLPPEMLQDLSTKLNELGGVPFELLGAAQSSKEALSESATKLGEKGAEILEDGAEKLGEKAGEALKGLGGLLKKE